MAQIINITSEALQATIRRLLPSQQGFGEDLQATNVVTPIIDLTPTAEGSVLPVNLQTALSFNSQTFFQVENSNSTIADSPGFYRIVGTASAKDVSPTDAALAIRLDDGSSLKTVWALFNNGITTGTPFPVVAINIDITVFLNAGESVVVVSNAANSVIVGSVRQVATVTGELVNPAGYVSQ